MVDRCLCDQPRFSEGKFLNVHSLIKEDMKEFRVEGEEAELVK